MKYRMKNRVVNTITNDKLEDAATLLSNDFTNLVSTIREVFKAGAKSIQYTFVIEYELPIKDDGKIKDDDLSTDFWIDLATGKV